MQEARLSTFLAADKNVTQVDDASTDTTEAFLSGQITDLQGRLNITNLAEGGQVQAVALRQRPLPRLRTHGAALLAAMLTVTLVATFAAAAMWQQWRAVEVETAERGHVQST